MLRDRFAHLRIQDSDSDSDDAHERTQRPVLDAPNLAVAGTDPIRPVHQDPIFPKSENPQVLVPPTSDIMRREEVPNPFEKDYVIKQEATAPPDHEVNIIKTSTSSEKDIANQSCKQSFNVANSPTPLSGGSFPQDVQEKRGPPKRRSIDSFTGSEKSKHGRKGSGSVNQSITATNEKVKSTGQLSSAKESLLEEQTQGQNINVKMSNQKEDNRKEEVSSLVGELQGVIAEEGTKKNSNSNNLQVQPFSTPMMDSNTNEVKMILSEKYWEKTYGFDPSKRGLPLFVAVEHCPPKNPGASSRLPQRNSLRVASEGPSSIRSSQNRSTKNSMLTAEDDLFIPDELHPTTHNDTVQQEGSALIVEDIPVTCADGNNKVDVLNNTDLALNAEGVGNDVKRDSIKECKSSVHGSVCEQVSFKKNQDDPFGDGDVNNEQEPNASKEEKNIQRLPSRNENSTDLSKVLGSDQSGNLIQKDENDQNLEKSNLSLSDVKINATVKENLSNDASPGASAEKDKNVKRDSQNLQLGNGNIEENGGVINMTPLTIGNLGKLNGNESGIVEVEEENGDISYSESSLFMSCISMPTADMREIMRDRKLSKEGMKAIYRQKNQGRLQESIIPPFHRRLLLDMEEIRERDRRIVARSIEEYTFQPKTSGRRASRLPQRLQKSFGAAAAAPPPPPETVTELRAASQERSRSTSRRKLEAKPLPTFKPEISKYARETQRSAIPYHERLYTPKPASPGDGTGLSNSHSPQGSPRMADLIEGSNSQLFRPDISPRARAIENGNPFHHRLYPSREELERRRAKSQSPPVSPRRSSPQRGNVQISPRLLERPVPPDVPSYPFHPEISPRAKVIENSRPFHQRLYPEKEILQRRAASQSPPVSPRRSSPQRGPVQISQRLLDRPAPPPDTTTYSFRPEISPRARSISRQGPFYERLYQTKEEKEHQEELQQEYNAAFIPSFHPNITERGQRAYENDDGVRRNVVKRLSKPKEIHPPPLDPSLSFHPVITSKARVKKTRNSNSDPQLLINGTGAY
ncbi:uncharacterized protein TM35_000013170 [Trypanosoma theileri]|uniref:Uncharacterized protein n=1 Tax=Trypanosoma theileri TaxID=67003 RepID=A0A1X0PAF9_9TRYP|nr:uncharacterized protein TM35_000013170 [Trypanosoma theileri]ORC93440.1 hypothetical protein TM35_000013170 [Trypanosoma theileri]